MLLLGERRDSGGSHVCTAAVLVLSLLEIHVRLINETLPLVQPFKSLGILYHQGEALLVYDGRRCAGTAAGYSQGKDISLRNIQWMFLVFLISASGHACFGFFETLCQAPIPLPESSRPLVVNIKHSSTRTFT